MRGTSSGGILHENVRPYLPGKERIELSDNDLDPQREEHDPGPPPDAHPREHVREMQTHLQEMEGYLKRMGERLRRLDEQLSHLEAEDDSAVDRGWGWPTGG